jgi:serine/tyrosine/threonine adenylyltransferase
MNDLPQAATDILDVADFLGDAVAGADFPQTILRFRNDRAAATIGLASLSDQDWISHFGRFVPIANSLQAPLALRYHGHQFRNYNPDIGDGRGFLFAQMRGRDARLLDLATKGSGQTPYSRSGDGRLTLKGAVREILATEMLEALGVNTSKTFSVIETGEALERNDEPSPTRGAILFRLSHGHIRIGSFQRLAVLHEDAALTRLVEYALLKYYGEVADGDAAARLLTLVTQRTAKLAASYMVAGFVHGVLNSDNINISGESFDYGPWRFTPKFEAGFTAAYFDHAGLYAFGRQAEAIHWDVMQLAISLTRISDQDVLIEALNGFGPAYQAALVEMMLWRLGVVSRGEEADVALVRSIEEALLTQTVEIDRFFFDWAGGARRSTSPADEFYDSPAFEAFKTAVAPFQPARNLEHDYWQQNMPCSLYLSEVEAIWERIATHDDWSLLEAKISNIREMGDAMLR